MSEIKSIAVSIEGDVRVFKSIDHHRLTWVQDDTFSVYSNDRLIGRFFKIDYFMVTYE